MAIDHSLTHEPAYRLSEMLDQREVSSVELTRAFLNRIAGVNPKISAYVTVADEAAMAQAEAADAAIAKNLRLGPFHGLPISIKDLVITKGLRTTRGSKAYEDWIPNTDDIVSERLRASGAVFLGKTNTPEFGHRGTTENRIGDPCRNPWDLTRTPGGSSGGAAAALIADLCPVATGSDGGGSVRIPAGFCGVYGIKPSQGRVPAPYDGAGGWRPFSQNGPMARTVRDACMLLQVMAGPDPRDPTAMITSAPDFLAACVPDVRSLRIAWSPDLGYAAVDPEVRRIAEQAALTFADLGAIVEQPALNLDGPLILETFRTIWETDLLANYGHLLRKHANDLDPVLRHQLEQAASWPALKLSLALRELERHRGVVRNIMADYDLLLTPSLAVPAFPLGEFPRTIDGRQVVDPLWDFTPFSYPFNMTGNPAASIPCGFTSEGLPVGLHLVGQLGDEATVIRASIAYEEARPWDGFRPEIA